MKKLISFLLVLGIGITQTSGAVETTFQPNNTLSHTIANISDTSNYGSNSNIYGTYKSNHIYSNAEISQAIDNLNAHAKQKEYQLASRSSKAVSDSLNDMKRWAEQGSAEYQVKVGRIYYDGKGVRQDLVLARKMFQKAAGQGDMQGQGMLGLFYEKGLGGLKRNRATAKEWYGKTCDQGSQYGCDNYRRLNERGY